MIRDKKKSQLKGNSHLDSMKNQNIFAWGRPVVSLLLSQNELKYENGILITI